MMQSLHILRKDIRHLWPELTIYAVILAAFGLVAPMQWDPAEGYNGMLGIFGMLLRLLIPSCWIFLIARLVHEESLVGDQQFWVTRPYKWQSLFAAKLMFLVLCIVLPFLAMQYVLVLQAGLHPLHSISGIGLSLGILALMAWLPLMVVAAVTTTVTTLFLTLAVFLLAWAGLLTMMYQLAGNRMAPPLAIPTFAVLFCGLMIATLLFQYARRETACSRALVVYTTVGFFAAFCGALALNATPPLNALVRTVYPADNTLHMVFNPAFADYIPRTTNQPATGPDLVDMTLPIQLQGLATGERLRDPHASFTLDAPGLHYTAPWRTTMLDAVSMSLHLPQSVMRQAAGKSVRMHVSLIADKLMQGELYSVTASDQFPIPGGGICMRSDFPGNNMSCRFAYQNETSMQVSTQVQMVPCGITSAKPHAAGTSLHVEPAGSRFDQVVIQSLRFGGTVCPGTQLSFQIFNPAGKLRVELDIPAISLEAYAANDPNRKIIVTSPF